METIETTNTVEKGGYATEIEGASHQMINHRTVLREVRAVYRGNKKGWLHMKTVADAAEAIRKVIPDNSREHFVCLYLNGANEMVAYAVVATGTANSCRVHPREVFQLAVLVGSVAIIFGHNHPSAVVTPSEDDKHLTKVLKKGAELLGIKILDHIVVTDRQHHSFFDNGGL